MVENKKKRSLTLHLLILFFIVVSLISISYAWFTYGNSATADFDVKVKAWRVEFTDGSEVITNSIKVVSSEIYPGMEPVVKEIEINNYGDTNAVLNTVVDSIRLFDTEYYDNTSGFTNEELIDKLAHDYPFHVNVALSDTLLPAETGKSIFKITITWPFNADNDVEDTIWGVNAYNFAAAEEAKLALDPTYEILDAIEIMLSVKAEQDFESNENKLDERFTLGETVMYDVVTNRPCTAVSATCLSTVVLDTSNKVTDATVTLLPSVNGSFGSASLADYNSSIGTVTSGWSVARRALELNDLLPLISTDIENSYITKELYSDIVIGNLSYGNRLDTLIQDTIIYGGNYEFLNDSFPILQPNSCVWTVTEFDVSSTYALNIGDNDVSTIESTLDTTQCKIVPVIMVNKNRF